MDVKLGNSQASDYQVLVDLFKDWREFETPPTVDGVPDYTAERFDNAQDAFKKLQQRLHSISIEDWPLSDQIDWHVVRAEMNGYDFNYRILKPWARDPAFYQTVHMEQSDVPAHEGPINHATLEFWQYEFPLTETEEKRMKGELEVIPTLLSQAKKNLIGNARDIWIAGINNLDVQVQDLDVIADRVGSHSRDASLLSVLRKAQEATKDFVSYLEEEAPKKTGPSGIGKENYTWYQQNVHLLSVTWEDEVNLLTRALDRAWSSLKLEEQQNKDLPPLVAANTIEEFDVLTELGVQRMMNFLTDKEIMDIKSNMEPALREHRGTFIPESERNFFNIGMHYDPLPLFSHFYHWFDLAKVRDEPHEKLIRRGPLLYNIFDSKNEGIATAVEEMFMHAGLYQDSPRSREIVWIMLAQRAARGLGSLYAHANELSMEEAGQVHVKWTPRGWMKREPHLMRFEQHLYLRQPGYGTCYITGKYVIERLLAEWAELLDKQNKPFVMKDFMNAFNNVGNIPVELVRWQMTGNKPNFKKWA